MNIPKDYKCTECGHEGIIFLREVASNQPICSGCGSLLEFAGIPKELEKAKLTADELQKIYSYNRKPRIMNWGSGKGLMNKLLEAQLEKAIPIIEERVKWEIIKVIREYIEEGSLLDCQLVEALKQSKEEGE